MPTKCILASKDEFLLGSILEELLTRSDDIDLIEIMGKSPAELIAAIERTQPEVIVLCHTKHDTMPADYLRILHRFPELLIIIVSPNDNYMHIYDKQKVLMTQSSDLLSVIQSHY